MIDGEDMRQAAMLIKSGALAAFGGMVGYLVDVTHGQKTFSWFGYGVFVLTAFFVGQILDSWLPSDMPGRGGLLMVAGTTAYPVLQVLRARTLALVEKAR
jgi:hypothetical protein